VVFAPRRRVSAWLRLAARALGARGYEVMLAEASRELGGGVTRESALPGMSEYARVRDHREQALRDMPNVGIFRESALTAEDVLARELDAEVDPDAPIRHDRVDVGVN
jgi:NADPH-dependent 2,4-dienoyl-CoA reductase/sulfur reductase-like enzyme